MPRSHSVFTAGSSWGAVSWISLSSFNVVVITIMVGVSPFWQPEFCDVAFKCFSASMCDSFKGPQIEWSSSVVSTCLSTVTFKEFGLRIDIFFRYSLR